METPTNQVPVPAPVVPPIASVAPAATHHMSPLLVTLIVGVLAILILALAYFSWMLREKYQTMIAAENALVATQEEVPAAETTSPSDEVAAIEADVTATDLEETDAEMAAMDAELESFEAELYAE